MPEAGEIFIGLMSGTSVDGIDAALVEFKSPHDLRLIDSQFTEFSPELRQRINVVAQSNSTLVSCEDSPLHQELAALYAKASLDLLAKSGLAAKQVRGIANHGQTVRHEPNAIPAFSLQLGDGQHIANLCNIPCYTQFRQADLAAGGQGAPLMPAFHSAVFAGKKNNLVLNIGGIANITCLGEPVIGFDTGPGNTLLDQWIHTQQGQRFDRDGEWAAGGNVIPELLSTWLADPYFTIAAPKSTGPDYFNLQWMGDLENHSAQDVQATLMALSIRSICGAIDSLELGPSAIYVCGGGAQNSTMMHGLAQALPEFKITRTDDLGVPSDWVEAVGFAWLGYCCAHGIESNLPSVTGASEKVVLGKVFLPA